MVETDTLVYAINVPTFSISSTHSGPINEAGTATFEITTYTNPGTDRIPIKIVPYNSLNTVGNIEYTGTYLNTGPGTSGTIRNVTLPAFTGNSPYTANFTVSTRGRDGVNTPQGKITVDLNHVTASGTSLNYAVDSDNDSASVLVNDDNKPTITIGNAPNINGGETAMFPLEASVAPYDALTIRYRPTNTGGSFLPAGVHNDDMQTSLVTFTPKPSDPTKSIGTLPVPTVSAQNATGSISVALEADLNTVDPKYNKGSGTGTVSLRGCLNTALSLRANTAEVTEGGTANITVNANANPLCSVRFRYSVSHTSGTNFLLAGENGTKVVDRTFSDPTPGVWTATISIRTDTVDMDYDPNGEFKVTLVAANPADTEQRYTIDTSMPNYNHIDVTVYDSIKPEIKIDTTEPETIHISGTNNSLLFREEIVLTSNIEPHDDLKVKFTVTETSTNTNFLKLPAPVEDTISFELADPPRTPQVYVGKIKEIEFVEVVGKESATYMLTLQEDANNYTLGTGIEKSKSFTVTDPSYFVVNQYGYGGPGAALVRDPEGLLDNDNGATEAFLYIRNPSIDYQISTATRVLQHETDSKLTFDASWYLNDSTTALGTSTPRRTNVNLGTASTHYGDWELPAGNWSNAGGPHRVRWNSKYIIESSDIANIPLDSRGRIELNLSIPDGIMEKSTLHLIHNTSTYWDSDKKSSLVERPTDTDIGTVKEATIKTYHNNLADLAFKSKLYDGNATAVEAPLSPNQAGNEWTHLTAYGTWVVRNQTTCVAATAKIRRAACYEVRFEPSTTNSRVDLQAISNKTVKLDLEVAVGTDETDILSYIVNGYDTTLDLTTPGSNQVFALTRAIDDVDGIATIHKKTNDDIKITTSEKTDIQGTPNVSEMKREDTDMHAEFLAKEYGHDLTYGSWFVEEVVDDNTVVDPVDTGFHSVKPKFFFKPNIDAIINLPTQSVRTSTLTIETKSGTDTITTETITVTITRLDIPVLSIEAVNVNSTVDEGRRAMFRVRANEEPTEKTITINVTPTDTEADHIDPVAVSNTGGSGASGVPRPIPLTFTDPSGTDTWISNTFEVILKAVDSFDTGRGTVTVVMDPITLDLNSEYGLAASPNNSAVVRIRDSMRPTITIADAAEVNSSTAYQGGKLFAKFPITASTRPHNDTMSVYFMATNTTNDFLALDENEIHSGVVSFSDPNSTGTFVGNLEVETTDDPDHSEGEFSIVLQEDAGYNLSAVGSEKTGSVDVIDPSYLRFIISERADSNNGGRTNLNQVMIHDGGKSVTLYIKDTTATYDNIVGYLQALGRDHRPTNRMKFHTKWLINGSEVDTTPQVSGISKNIAAGYGRWIIHNWFPTHFHASNDESFFLTDDNAINSIPLGSDVEVQLHMEVANEQRDLTSLHFLHYTSPLWESNSTGILAENQKTADFSVMKDATISTFHTKLSEFSFKSKLYDGSSTPTEFTLEQIEQVAEWPGMEWTAPTGYGQWIVGNPRVCETDKRCFDVRFIPDATAISGISAKSVKNDLEVILTENGTVTETKTLTYNIIDENTSLSLDGTASNVIRTSDTITNLSGTATTFKDTSHNIDIEVNETTDNQGTFKDKDDVTNDDTVGDVAGFDSIIYGNNLDLGTWHFEGTNHTTNPYLNGTEFHTVTRRFQFRPDSTFIGNLRAGEVRYSTLTVKTLNGTDTISSQTFTIAIYRSDLPNFKISIANSTINEGETAEFTITADRNPGTSPVTIHYIPTNTVGSFLSGTSDSSTSKPVIFQSQGSNTWTGTLEVETNNNSGDETHGVITVVLDESTTTYTTATAPDNTASVSITDLSTPTISIAAAPDIVEGQFARFKVTSNIRPWKPLAIRYTPTESSTEFLDTTNGASGTTRVANPAVTFTPEGNSFTGTLLVPTQVDSDMDSGTITVQLEDDSNTTQRDYQLSSNTAERSNSVNIVETPQPELSIISENFAIDETNPGSTATIKVKASVNPLRQFPISFTPTDETGSNVTYLAPDIEENESGDPRTTRVWFTEEDVPDPDNPGQTIAIWTAEIMIKTVIDDGKDNPHGKIRVTLNAVAGVNTVASGANDVVVTVNDSTKPVIKIGTPPENIQLVNGNDRVFTIKPITITSNFEPHGNSLDIKFRRSEPNTDFFDPKPADDDEQTQTINFTTNNSITSGTMQLSLKDDPDAGSGVITITLLEDDVNYTLSTVGSEKSTQITVDDPSYIEVNTYKIDAGAFPGATLIEDPENMFENDGLAQEGILYVRDPSTNYVITNFTRVLGHETKVLSFSASWYTDDSTTPLGKSEEDYVNVSNGTVTTKFGNWILPVVTSSDPTDTSDGWGTTGAPNFRKASRFEISSEHLSNIPHGSDGRIELNLGIPNDVTDKSTLHIRHYTTAFWNSNRNPVLTTDRNSTEINNRKEAKIRTFHESLSGLSFESKLYDGMASSVDAMLLEPNNTADYPDNPDFTGEVTVNTTYGRWTVGNETDCARGAKCLDVRFEPDTTAQIGNKIIKIELVVKVLTDPNDPSTEIETDTLTYFIDGNTVTTALEDGDSQTINSPATPIDIDDVAATATIFSRITDTFNIVVNETTTNPNPNPNQPTPTTTGAISTDTNMIAGFSSKEYGTDLALGKWYFDEVNTGSTTVDEVDSGYQTIMRKILFKPDPDGIAELPAGAERISTITISRVRGDKTVATNSFSVTINRVNVPGLTITPPEVIIVEGDDLNFTVTSDIQPTTNPLTVSYIVSQPQGSTEGGTYVDTVTEMVDSSRPVPLTFTQMPNSTVWIATLPIALKDADQTNAISGGVKVELDEPDDNTNYFVAGGEGNEAGVIVYDKGLPVITIQDVTPVFNGTAATLTFTFPILRQPIQ